MSVPSERRRGARGQFSENVATARASQAKARRRQRAKRLRERFFQRHAVWTVQKMDIAREEIEWRVLVLTGPDTRSLTAKLLGDPHPMRSALYARQRGWL